MHTIYRLKADELDARFVDSIKALFADQTIDITVCEAETAAEDDTAYLLADPTNRARLLAAVDNVRNQKNLVTVNLDDLQ